MTPVDRAARIAEHALARELPERWRHVVGVAQRAETASERLRLNPELVCAAWLHDVGYSSAANRTDFHPLDGAHFVLMQGFDKSIAALVAHHTCARIEATERGLAQELEDSFAAPDGALLAVLTYCDLHVGPGGIDMTLDERLADIARRYEPDSIVARSIRKAEPELRAIVRVVELALEKAQSQ